MDFIRMRRSGSGHGSGAGGAGMRDRIMRSSRSVDSPPGTAVSAVTISYSSTPSDHRSDMKFTSPESSRSGEA